MNNNIKTVEEKLTEVISYIIKTGLETVKPELKDEWFNAVIEELSINEIDFKYQLTIFIAAVTIMLKLSNNENIADVYDLIDVQSHKCIFNKSIITGWQNTCISNLVKKFHERGLEFAEYRSERIKPKQKQF